MTEQIPRHVGIIMDGNTRWAKAHGFSDSLEGHKAGADMVEKIVAHAAKRGVEILTVYAMSSENFTGRAKREVKGLIALTAWVLKHKFNSLKDNGVALDFWGELKILPASLRRLISKVVAQLKRNNRIKLNVALNYGGRSEIVKVVQQLLAKGIPPAEVNEKLIAEHLYSKDCPDPDLIIRTGGNLRISNFLLWQCTYSELYFTNTLWPDFGEAEFDRALADYAERKRTFGVTHAVDLAS